MYGQIGRQQRLQQLLLPLSISRQYLNGRRGFFLSRQQRARHPRLPAQPRAAQAECSSAPTEPLARLADRAPARAAQCSAASGAETRRRAARYRRAQGAATLLPFLAGPPSLARLSCCVLDQRPRRRRSTGTPPLRPTVRASAPRQQSGGEGLEPRLATLPRLRAPLLLIQP